MELRIRAVHRPLDLTQIAARTSLAELREIQTEREILFEQVDWDLLTRDLWTPEKVVQEVWARWPTQAWSQLSDVRIPRELKHFHPREWSLNKDFLLSLPLGTTMMIPDGSLVDWYDWKESQTPSTCRVCSVWLDIYSPGTVTQQTCPACQVAIRLLHQHKVMDVQDGDLRTTYQLRVVCQLYLLLEEEVLLYRDAAQRNWRLLSGVTGEAWNTSYLSELPQPIQKIQKEPQVSSWSPPWWKNQ